MQKCQFCGFLKSMLLLSRKACFLRRTSQKTFSQCFLHKTKCRQNLKFMIKTMDKPLWKNATDFAVSLKRCFRCQERLVFCIKRQKSFSHDLFSRSIKWGYRWLQGVTEGYKGLQRVARGYTGLQWVTENLLSN